MPIYKMEGKKDGLQKYRVRINYRDAFGNQRQLDRVCYGKEESKELERKLLAEKAAAPTQSVSDLYRSYLEHLKITVRPSSFRNTETYLRLYVMSAYQNAKLSDLTTASLLKWKTSLAETTLSPRSKKNVFGVFSAMLNWAERMDFIASNPLRKIGNFRQADFETPQDKIRYYTAQEYLRFAACALADAEKTGYYGYYVFFSIAFYTGMRKGEINALRWSDIEGSTIHVRRSVHQKVKGVAILETAPKTRASYRDLQMPDPLAEILATAKSIQQKDPLFEESYRVCGAVRCLSDSAIDNRNRQYAQAAGLPRIKIHDFRHTHASLLANEGINIQEIARRLGHSDVETTWNTYSHLYPREEERAVKILNEIKNV